MRTALAVLIFLGADSKFVQRDLDKVKADYLIVAPPTFADSLDSLCEHRSKSYRVAVVRTDDVAAKFGAGAEGIAKLVAAAKPRFLLLAGDAEAVPTFLRPSAYTSERFASDRDLATDHPFGAVTGRFPADTVDELRAMVAKTVDYETALKPGRWQKKIAFVTGEGGFGPVIDTILESQFSSVVTDRVPPGYDVETAYAKASSKYCSYPPKFNDHAVSLLNEGALFYTYVGHGMRTSFDDVRYNDFSFPIFQAKDAARVEVRDGLPVMVVIACSTGQFDSKLGDCIGETLFKRPRGPVAFIGGSRVTQPYGNALLGRKLVDHVFHRKPTTIGEALWDAKAAVVERDESALRRQADALAALVQGPASLEPMRQDVILHYNLLGDPALVLRRPEETIELTPRGLPGPGRLFVVTGKAPPGPVEITFECPRNRFYHPVDLVGE
ncbi:MAG: C25 family cysteine peptidase, partial [Candidatus Rokuibacteriota bacterium]